MRTTSNDSTYFAPPTPQRPSRRMWLIVALCVFLPPVGLILLWSQARNPLRGKLIVSIIALLSMTLMITIYLNIAAANRYRLDVLPPSAGQLQGIASTPAPGDTPAPTGAPVPQNPDAAQGGASGTPQQTPVPADPNR